MLIKNLILMEKKFDRSIRYFTPNQFPSIYIGWMDGVNIEYTSGIHTYSLSQKEVKFYCEGFGAILCKLIVLCVAFVSVREKEKPTV